MYFDFARFNARERYKLLSSTITPRPIAWVTLDARHDDTRTLRKCSCVGQSRVSRNDVAAAVGHRGASPEKVCTMLCSQPGMLSTRTAVNPASRMRR